MGCQETSLKPHSSLQWRWWSPGPLRVLLKIQSKKPKCRDTGSPATATALRLPKRPGLASSAEVFRKVFWVLAEILDALGALGGDGPVGATWGESNLWNQGITQQKSPSHAFAINVECGPPYGVLVRPRVPSPSLEWNAKQDGGISWCHWGQIPTHQLSLFLYHHYTSQDVYTSRYSSWIGSKSI